MRADRAGGNDRKIRRPFGEGLLTPPGALRSARWLGQRPATTRLAPPPPPCVRPATNDRKSLPIPIPIPIFPPRFLTFFCPPNFFVLLPPSFPLKLLTILGARPQFIKAATVSRAIRDVNADRPSAGIVEVIVHTGQQFE